MGNTNRILEIVVVHKGPRKNSKVIMEIFENTRVDDIITTGATLEACINVLTEVKNVKISIATMAIA